MTCPYFFNADGKVRCLLQPGHLEDHTDGYYTWTSDEAHLKRWKCGHPLEIDLDLFNKPTMVEKENP